MRLLNVYTFKFREFFDGNTPSYLILSHRWTDSEITYKQFLKGENQHAAGYRKIIDFCEFAKTRNETLNSRVDWVWIDTCCIHKAHSAELSEAINSMYRWYQQALECYVHLSDVNFTKGKTTNLPLKGDCSGHWDDFDCSLWFTRGWTLQELLAPRTVIFCDASWNVFGHVCESSRPSSDCAQHSMQIYGTNLDDKISRITGIPITYLKGQAPLEQASIAQRISWSATRHTTKIEDQAHCLLGLLNINMPIMYGHGEKAFLYLQEKVIEKSTDQSIFAWTDPDGNASSTRILAPSPRMFAGSAHVTLTNSEPGPPYAINNRGLQLSTKAVKLPRDQMKVLFRNSRLNSRLAPAAYVVTLNCAYPQSSQSPYGPKTPVRIALGAVNESETQFCRLLPVDFGQQLEREFTVSSRRIDSTVERTFFVDV